MERANAKRKIKTTSKGISTFAFALMNVAVIASLSGDGFPAFFGLPSITFFVIAAIVFFIPIGLIVAELAGGWNEPGGVFRWVGEGLGRGWALTSVLLLWMLIALVLGSSAVTVATLIGFFTPQFLEAVAFADNPTNLFWILLGCLGVYWLISIFATKNQRWVSRIASFGVIIGTLIPLIGLAILTIIELSLGEAPRIDLNLQDFLPPDNTMTLLTLTAGTLLAFTGLDVNAVHIQRLKGGKSHYPRTLWVAMVIALFIFIGGTLCINLTLGSNDINATYALLSACNELGTAYGAPWLSMVFAYLGLGGLIAFLLTGVSASSTMLSTAARGGLLPRFFQTHNKHSMPTRLIAIQMALITVIALVVGHLVNNGLDPFAFIAAAITILYLFYYLILFIAFLRLRFTQPNRPRSFRIAGGNFGAGIVAGLGIVSCLCGILAALWIFPTTYGFTGTGLTAPLITIAIVAIVALIAGCLAAYSRNHSWADPTHRCPPFTWQIEGLKKPSRVKSNVPVTLMSREQAAMGLPIERPYDPDASIILPTRALSRKKSQKATTTSLISPMTLKLVERPEPHKSSQVSPSPATTVPPTSKQKATPAPLAASMPPTTPPPLATAPVLNNDQHRIPADTSLASAAPSPEITQTTEPAVAPQLLTTIDSSTYLNEEDEQAALLAELSRTLMAEVEALGKRRKRR